MTRKQNDPRQRGDGHMNYNISIEVQLRADLYRQKKITRRRRQKGEIYEAVEYGRSHA